MTAPTFLRISNEIRDYAWGAPGGISRSFGHPVTTAPEAELWLGAHPLSPSLVSEAPWPDLARWEEQEGVRLPYLMKVLAAASPLSLQAHPTPADAATGFAKEEARGIPRDAAHRNYKDPYAKPELIVAVDDGFEALCGFRPIAESIADVAALSALTADPAAFRPLLDALAGADGVRVAFEWLLSGAPEATVLVDELVTAAGRDPERFELVLRIAGQYPGDPGIAVALLLNHTTLRAGECLWLPAGNIHAYLRGLGVELMGPSDNVLRGGLTPKHVDVPELLSVLDFTDGPAPYLAPGHPSPHVAVYRPATLPSGAGVPFDLKLIEGDASIATGSPAIGVVLDGSFVLRRGDEEHRVTRGESVLVSAAGEIAISGEGRLYLASAE